MHFNSIPMKNVKTYLILASPTILYQSSLISNKVFTACIFLFIFTLFAIRVPERIRGVKLFSGIICSLFVFFALYFYTRNQIDQNWERGAKLVNHLEAYYNKYNHYPAKLTDLKPEFTSSIPRVGRGIISKSFYYETDSAARYEISMEVGMGEEKCHWSTGMGWGCPY